MFDASLGGSRAWSVTLNRAVPLGLAGLAVAVAGSMGLWNIGAEGQYILGAIVGGGVAVFLHDSTSPALLPCMLVFGVLGGMLWAGIPALLKTRFNANEILVSLMLVYVAELLLVYLVHGPVSYTHLTLPTSDLV